MSIVPMLLAAVLGASGSEAGPRLRMEVHLTAGKLNAISWNGVTLVRNRTLTWVRDTDGKPLPSWIETLRDPRRGRNELRLTYTATANGLEVRVSRVAEDGAMEPLTTRKLPASTTPREEVIAFDVGDGLPPSRRASLTKEQRAEVLELLRGYHAALSRRDVEAAHALWTSADRERMTRTGGHARLLGDPAFAMKPLDDASLEWRIWTSGVELVRPDGGAVLEGGVPGGSTFIGPRVVVIRRMEEGWRLATVLP